MQGPLEWLKVSTSYLVSSSSLERVRELEQLICPLWLLLNFKFSGEPLSLTLCFGHGSSGGTQGTRAPSGIPVEAPKAHAPPVHQVEALRAHAPPVHQVVAPNLLAPPVLQAVAVVALSDAFQSKTTTRVATVPFRYKRW